MYRNCALWLVIFLAVGSWGCKKAEQNEGGPAGEAGVAPSVDSGPVGVVKEFLTLARGGKWEEARKLMDLDSRAAAMFAEIYGQGTPEEKAQTQEILWERFVSNLGREFEALKGEEPKYLGGKVEEGSGKTEVTVEYAEFKFHYGLELKGEWLGRKDVWVIVDRAHEKGGVRSSTKMGVKAVLNAAERELGRKPNLGELNKKLPETMGSVRVHGFRVGGGGPSERKLAPKVEHKEQAPGESGAGEAPGK